MMTESSPQQDDPTMDTIPLDNNNTDKDIEAAIQNRPQQSHQSQPSQNASNHNKYVDPGDESTNSKTGVSKRKTFKERLTDTLQVGSSHAHAHAPSTQGMLHVPPATKAPKETLKAVYAAGKYKAGLTLDVLCVQSFMAGIYIAAAGHLYLVVGGGVLGSALFPGGLIAVALTSAELFTGDALVFVAALLGGHVSIRNLLRNWSVSWCCNFVGSILWAVFMGYLSHAIVDSHADELCIKVAEKKALNDFGSIFIKAIGANFMVCVAVWQGTCAEEVAGKVLGLWFPTAAFVMMGFDHVVANMFLIPMGMLLGAKVSVGRLFAALAVATCGNAVGGGIFVGAIYWYVFDSMASFGGLTSRIRHNMTAVGRNMSTLHLMPGNISYRNSHHHHPHHPAHHTTTNTKNVATTRQTSSSATPPRKSDSNSSDNTAADHHEDNHYEDPMAFQDVQV